MVFWKRHSFSCFIDLWLEWKIPTIQSTLILSFRQTVYSCGQLSSLQTTRCTTETNGAITRFLLGSLRLQEASCQPQCSDWLFRCVKRNHLVISYMVCVDQEFPGQICRMQREIISKPQTQTWKFSGTASLLCVTLPTKQLPNCVFPSLKVQRARHFPLWAQQLKLSVSSKG